ncbi:hypothetical protein RhiirA5_377703 [Rhizophagus irregularis]|uniref:Uncharacterized protein n=1 Tax=Rhizophagus irregularis TaxID=588596 RepID=A0A2I1EGV1_9GLOM|nr:hypothetical protein RhiirA5_377703 [Rhizophagus irregularis]PKY21347.1 hypothetical protein RhiirB3_385608 [Rhizophagus irregularis]
MKCQLVNLAKKQYCNGSESAVIPDRVSPSESGRGNGKGRGRCVRFASKVSMSKKKSTNKYNQESYVRQEKQPSQPLAAPVPDVPEPEPKQTIALRKYLESLCLNEQVLSRVVTGAHFCIWHGIS